MSRPAPPGETRPQAAEGTKIASELGHALLPPGPFPAEPES
jgi:hypothetical protein